MAEPVDHTISLLLDIRAEVVGMNTRMDQQYRELEKRINNLQRAFLGESVLGQYASLAFDTRISELEKWVRALEDDARAQLNATLTDDSGSSCPKQR